MTHPIVELQRHGDIAVIVVDNPPVNTITAEVRAALGPPGNMVAILVHTDRAHDPHLLLWL